jgi:hypothetical protein
MEVHLMGDQQQGDCFTAHPQSKIIWALGVLAMAMASANSSSGCDSKPKGGGGGSIGPSSFGRPTPGGSARRNTKITGARKKSGW